MKFLNILFVALAASMLPGCASFLLQQTDSFVDGDGNVITVEYGRRSRPYEYEIVSPINGFKLPCKDDKMVRIMLPDQKQITCRLCQNDSPRGQGTMYMTTDKRWKFLTVGLASWIFIRDEARRDYLLVFEGNLAPGLKTGRR
jgi:hypothetical protein